MQDVGDDVHGQTKEMEKLRNSSHSPELVVVLPLGVIVSTVCEVGDPWTSGGFLTEHV